MQNIFEQHRAMIYDQEVKLQTKYLLSEKVISAIKWSFTMDNIISDFK